MPTMAKLTVSASQPLWKSPRRRLRHLTATQQRAALRVRKRVSHIVMQLRKRRKERSSQAATIPGPGPAVDGRHDGQNTLGKTRLLSNQTRRNVEYVPTKHPPDCAAPVAASIEGKELTQAKKRGREMLTRAKSSLGRDVVDDDDDDSPARKTRRLQDEYENMSSVRKNDPRSSSYEKGVKPKAKVDPRSSRCKRASMHEVNSEKYSWHLTDERSSKEKRHHAHKEVNSATWQRTDERSSSKHRSSAHKEMNSADSTWNWTDEEQVIFRPVVRINVRDADAAQRVTDARFNGVPVCLTGHCGWPQFAKRWLQPLRARSASANDDWIDLSQAHKVNTRKMITDIGAERVPLLRPDYDEEKPCKENILVSSFLKKYWKTDDDDKNSGKRSSLPTGYMHQWQFPLAAARLCNMVQPLPNDIFGEDLLRHWLDDDQCQGDCPLQYLFMGDAGTMSKLHRDNGGLAISIAPIVGEKECVMVHRADGASCMYYLAAKPDEIDLHQYPLMSFARIWKTVVRPGEILIMPQGTYHQCRNVTPCLSYSRFHLDTVNLRPFLESWINRDATEIDHSEVIWNASCKLWQRLDEYVKRYHECTKSKLVSLSTQPLPPEIIRTVNTLRSLRHICRAIAQRLEHVKCDDLDDIHGQQWNDLVYDIDLTLHEFRCRHGKPSTVLFSARDSSELSCAKNNLKTHPEEAPVQLASFASLAPKAGYPFRSRTHHFSRLAKEKIILSNQESFRTAGFLPKMHEVLSRLANLCPHERDFTICDSIQLFSGAQIIVRYQGKRIKGKIINVVEQMKAAYISFEGYGPCYDEYQAFECLRTPMTGDFSVGVNMGCVKEGSVVLNRWGENGEEYRAVVLHTRSGTFYLAALMLGRHQIKRWITREMVIDLVQSTPPRNSTALAPHRQSTQSAKLSDSSKHKLFQLVNQNSSRRKETKILKRRSPPENEKKTRCSTSKSIVTDVEEF